MTARAAISRAPRTRRTSRRIRSTAILSSLLALVLITFVVITLVRANDMLRQPAKPLATFSSNILPAFTPVSFPTLDEQNRLFGWFFSPETKPVSTIILVHDQGENRLQFGLDSAKLYEYLIDKGFCVLAFDLRRSGQSDSSMSGYGYAEWADVVAAINYVRKNAVTQDVLLYGFGSGSAASLLAADQLPPAGTIAAAAAGDAQAEQTLKKYPENIQSLGFDQSYIKGFLLDTPCSSPDEYIRADCRAQDWLGENLLQYTVPYAIRFSAGTLANTSLITILTRSQLPVFLTYSAQPAGVRQSSVLTLSEERQRLHPDTTLVYVSEKPGYVSGYTDDPDAYLAAVGKWLKRFFK